MKETAMMQLISCIPPEYSQLIKLAEQMLEIEKKQIVEAFNKSIQHEVYNTGTYINGEEYYDKIYNDY